MIAVETVSRTDAAAWLMAQGHRAAGWLLLEGCVIRAIDVALTQLGVVEATGHNDGVPAVRYMRGDKLAWCAGFVLWCFEMSDDPPIQRKATDYWELRNVEAMEQYFKRLGRWLGPALTPEPNDVIFYGNRGGSDAGRGRHVGIVERVENGVIHSVEGNLGDAVRRAQHRVGHPRITGFGRVTP